MRRERPAVDLPAEEELPEREAAGGMERSGESVVEEESDGVERETPVEESGDAGEESPPADADRAALLP
jgi:hypothetical protein